MPCFQRDESGYTVQGSTCGHRHKKLVSENVCGKDHEGGVGGIPRRSWQVFHSARAGGLGLCEVVVCLPGVRTAWVSFSCGQSQWPYSVYTTQCRLSTYAPRGRACVHYKNSSIRISQLWFERGKVLEEVRTIADGSFCLGSKPSGTTQSRTRTCHHQLF
ncbi:hypothetical protein BaRGS_00014763 [Batillaria attramentaria]|uniref:Uncharacterized protein n=1 Tax=Batillaria attramentaria TaxID=370345 RepID=A0ABD0L3P0_9CAEN